MEIAALAAVFFAVVVLILHVRSKSRPGRPRRGQGGAVDEPIKSDERE